jgi:hypothetical protein
MFSFGWSCIASSPLEMRVGIRASLTRVRRHDVFLIPESERERFIRSWMTSQVRGAARVASSSCVQCACNEMPNRECSAYRDSLIFQ